MEHGIDLQQPDCVKGGCKRSSSKVHEAKWLAMYSKLETYREKHGDCSVPRRFKDDPPLGNWVFNQRKLFHDVGADGRPALAEDRIKRLEKIGFEWEKNKRAPGSKT